MLTLTNIDAMNARFSMAKNARDIGVSMERLSTGSRVNSAVDGASDLAIAKRLHTRVMGLAMAVKNAADGSSLLNTADGALQEVQALLQRMRELSLSSANGAVDPADRVALNKEYQAALAEIGRIGSATEWNGKTLFDGQGFPGTTKFQVGADAGDTFSVVIDKLATSELGTVTGGSFVSHASTPPSAVTTQDSFTSHAETAPSVQTTAGRAASLGSDFDGDGDVDIALSREGGYVHTYLNDGSGDFTHVGSDSFGSYSGDGRALAAGDFDGDGDVDIAAWREGDCARTYLNDGSGDFTYLGGDTFGDTSGNGRALAAGDFDGDVDIAAWREGDYARTYLNDGSGDFTYLGGDTFGATSGDGRALASSSIVTATPAKSVMDFSLLNLSLGDKVTVTVTGGTNVSAVLDSSGLAALLTSLSNDLAAQSSLFSAATNSNGVLSVSGLTDGSAIASMSVSLEAGVDTTRLDFNNKNLVEGDQIVIQVSGGTDVQGTIDSNGLDSLLGTLATQLQSQSALFSNAFVNNGVLGVTGPADGGAIASVSVLLNTSSTSLDSTSVVTVGSASAAITSLDQAIDDVTGMQVKYGAAVNALNHVTDNLMNVKIQTQSSLSQVMDTDYAVETSRFAAAQIIRQASTAILAQANTSKETILTLLKDL
ncbi:FG-GAP-like repeat-containing protein [Luminiphilus sp.]|nr:FG-GAP-like repeat-containing protein [Luminiphilus sp.]